MIVGRVALVGAGPGDPSLLTLRAAELLRAADVVAYDELVSEAILAFAPESAELLPVGRRAGKGDPGYRLHPEVLARAQRGLFVVRLKAGDPLVFGRGGEEAAELARAGIPFEIVPGISAVLGAAAYAGIPLTHRNHSAELVISTAHRVSGRAPSPESQGGRTLALYMASHELERNLADVVAAGWSPNTPAALIVAATTADERTITGTLATLSSCAVSARIERVEGTTLPALVLIGDVVSLREELDWRSPLPLRGRRIIVARARISASRVARSLRTLGGEVIELPHVEREMMDASSDLVRAVESRSYGAVLIACDEGADALGEAMQKAPGLALPRILAVGSPVAARLRAHGISTSHTIHGACAYALAAREAELRGKHVLVPTADRGRPNLDAELARIGAMPHFITVARDRHVAPARWPSRVDLVVLPASSAARALYAGAPPQIRQATAVAMGARTAEEALRCGARRVVAAESDTVDALVDAVVRAALELRTNALSSACNAAVQEIAP